MKTSSLARLAKSLVCAIAVFSLLLLPESSYAGWRLVGITGQQGNADDLDPQGGFLYPDNTLYDISIANGAITKMFQATYIPDSHSVGYCPVDGLLYHTGGSDAYRDNPLSTGHPQGLPDILGLAYQDNQYMEKINLVTQTAIGVYNCNPCPNPDNPGNDIGNDGLYLPCFGLPAPLPAWMTPAYRRDSTQTAGGPPNREKGPNEPGPVRGMAWSASEGLFYMSTGDGIYKMTRTGVSTFLAQPAFTNDAVVGDTDLKGIAFVTVGGVTKLWVGHRDAGYIMQVDPATGDNLGELALNYPTGGGDPVDEFGGLLGLAQHPETGVIYGIRHTADQFARELVTIDLATGNTAVVGNMAMHMASMSFVQTEWRLVGITGQQGNADDLDPQGGFLYPDNTIYKINHASGALTKLFQATYIPDSHSVGYCPADGLLYHTGGSDAYRDNPLSTGHPQGLPDILGLAYQDNQYMEKINLVTQTAIGVYNCNPCPNPDNPGNDIGNDGLYLPCFGLVAPVPSWVLPAYRRDSTQTAGGPPNREKGPNEPGPVRGTAWSASQGLFYMSTGDGIYKMTRTGVSTFLAQPAFTNDAVVGDTDLKGIAFVTVGGVTKLWVGHRDAGYIMQVDPATGDNLGELALNYPTGGGDPVDEFGGLLGLAQHPETGVIYGIRHTADQFARELVTIDLATGNTAVVGNMAMHMASISFAATLPVQITSVARSGNNIALTWSGGLPPYEVQSRPSLTSGAWSTVTNNILPLSATILNGGAGPTGFFRVIGN